MGTLETFLVTAGLAATKAAAAGVVKKSGALFSQKFAAPLFERRKAKKTLIDSAKKYIAKIDKATRVVTTVAINGSVALDDIYIPLTLVDHSQQISFCMDRFPDELFQRSRCVLLTDTAGMGKSTATRFMVQATLVALKVLPIWVELRRVAQSQSLIEHICLEVFGKSSDEEKLLLQEVLGDGSVLVLLDGYDEIDDQLRRRLNDEIDHLSTRFDKCWFMVASRPDSELKGLSQFCEYNIRPLEEAEAFALIRKYDAKGSVADRLISKVEGNPQIQEFLQNPLLVSLLFKAFDYKATIPLKRHIFFRQVFDALYQDHDLSKGAAFERKKKTGLDIEDFHRAVRALGIATHLAGKVQYQPEEFQALLEGAKEIALPLIFDASKLRSDLLSAVPIFTKDGAEVRWSHKAFQDYFAAQYIYYDARSGRDDLIASLLDPDNPRKHENIMQIFVDLDRELVNKLIVAPIVKDMLDRFDGSFEKANGLSFKLFQCNLIGSLFFMTRQYKEGISRTKDGEGFRDFLTRVGVSDGHNQWKQASLTSAGIDKGCMIVVNRFMDRLTLVSNLVDQSPKPVSHKNLADLSGSFALGSLDFESVWKLLQDGKVKEDAVVQAFESLHGLRLLDKQGAEKVLADACLERPSGAQWLASIVKAAKSEK